MVAKIHTMQHFSADDIKAMEQRFRAMFINSLSGYKSANLIGTMDADKATNLAIVSSVVHLGADPALVGFISRPHCTERHTLENILQTKSYTINQVTQRIWQQAHQTSARYNKQQSEFDMVNLTPEFSPTCHAPFVLESPIKWACRLVSADTLSVNDTVFVIGEITEVMVSDEALCADGYVDIQTTDTVAISGLDSYHTGQRLARLSYAKPDRSAHFLP